MSKRPRFYVVWQGRKAGIFSTWEECKAQVHGFADARFKSFPSRTEAEIAFQSPPADLANTSVAASSAAQENADAAPDINTNTDTNNADVNALIHVNSALTFAQPAVKPAAQAVLKPILNSYSVDASCLGNPGPMEYRCVHTQTKEEIFRQGPYEMGTNNIGEFLALVHAVALFQQKGINLPIYSDSLNAISWLKKKRCNTKLVATARNAAIFALIKRAEHWLAHHPIHLPILKWQTHIWGEIPADFARK